MIVKLLNVVAGCSCCLNTDNRFLGSTTSTAEILHAVQDVGLSWNNIKQLLLTGARASFYWRNEACAAERDAWVDNFEREIDALLTSHNC